MTRCTDHHHHPHTARADGWTKFAAVGSGITSFISDAYYLGNLVDLFGLSEDQDIGIGLSWYGLGIGCSMSLLLTLGSVYSHAILNINHQQHAPDIPLTKLGDYDSCANNPIDHQASPEETADDYDSCVNNHADSHKHHHDEKTLDEENEARIREPLEAKPKPPGLTLFQKAALVTDAISHSLDIAGPLTFVGNMATKDALPFAGKMLMQCGATLFGGLASVAEVRTCKNSMLKTNLEAQLVTKRCGKG